MRQVALLLALSLACGSPAWGQEIKLGVVASITGGNAAKGEQVERGATAAVRDINAKGGVLGRKLKMIVEDDACDPEQAVRAAGTMIEKGVQAVIGHVCSGASIPASDVYVRAHLLQITPASSTAAFTERGLDNVFRVCGRDDRQAKIAVDYLARNFKGKPVAVIDDKSLYGKALGDEVKKELVALGMPAATYEEIDQGQEDFTDLLAKLKKLDVAALYFGGYQVEAGMLIKQARAAGLTFQLIGGNSLATKEFWQIAGTAGDGLLMTGLEDPRTYPAAKDVVEAFRRDHFEPDGYTLFSYAAVQVFAQAAELAKTTDLAALSKPLHGETFRTVTGDIGFDAKGDLTSPHYVLFKWQNGAYSPL